MLYISRLYSLSPSLLYTILYIYIQLYIYIGSLYSLTTIPFYYPIYIYTNIYTYIGSLCSLPKVLLYFPIYTYTNIYVYIGSPIITQLLNQENFTSLSPRKYIYNLTISSDIDLNICLNINSNTIQI